MHLLFVGYVAFDCQDFGTENDKSWKFFVVCKEKCSDSPTETSVLGAIRFQEVAICWCMWEF